MYIAVFFFSAQHFASFDWPTLIKKIRKEILKKHSSTFPISKMSMR